MVISIIAQICLAKNEIMDKKHIIVLLGFLFLAFLSLILGLHIGSYQISSSEILQIIGGNTSEKSNIILETRLPRVILAMSCGAILSLCGFFMQALLKNPLADPYIMGVTSGAGLGVNLLLIFGANLLTFSIFTQPFFACIGSLLSLFLVISLGYKSLFARSERLLLAGVACSSICTAFTGVLIYRFSENDQIRKMIFWTFGNFEKATPEIALIAAILAICCILFGIFYSPTLDVLILGEEQAHSLGLSIRKNNGILLIFTSLFTGGIVAFTGPIGFVGMMIPHFCRAFLGSSHRKNMIFGAFMGGTYLSLCDSLSRWFLPPVGLPIGIITAILGVPFFIYILYKEE